MSKVSVTNHSASASVLVAHRTIKPGETLFIPTKDLRKWYEKGGKRLEDDGTITIDDERPVIATRHEEKPEPSNPEAPEAFDGSPVSTTPQEGGVEEAPPSETSPFQGTPDEQAAEGLPQTQAEGNDGEVKEEAEESKTEGDEPKAEGDTKKKKK